jgi:hypothetical protein
MRAIVACDFAGAGFGAVFLRQTNFYRLARKKNMCAMPLQRICAEIQNKVLISVRNSLA